MPSMPHELLFRIQCKFLQASLVTTFNSIVMLNFSNVIQPGFLVIPAVRILPNFLFPMSLMHTILGTLSCCRSADAVLWRWRSDSAEIRTKLAPRWCGIWEAGWARRRSDKIECSGRTIKRSGGWSQVEEVGGGLLRQASSKTYTEMYIILKMD